ncbi:MAG: aminopeptidase P family protein [Deltaproteobacteria bacterium]|nr:aminopeptidase P family protein [Candidatus Zymogenaceae bacterium]
MNTDRIERLQEYIKSLDLDGVLITDMKNVRYYTGFTGSDGMLVLGLEGGVFLTDGRYVTQASGEVSGFAVERYMRKADGVRKSVADLGLTRVGVESFHISLAMYKNVSKVTGFARFVPIERDLAELRMIKSADEISLMRRAVSISEAALEDVAKMISPGVSERDIASELEYVIRKRGSGPLPFPVIVATGEHGAHVHASPGDRTIEAGDFVIIDFGAEYRGYASDQTITYMVGRSNDRAREVYDAVRGAQREAITRVRAGVSAVDIDAAARDFLAEKGYGEFFTHGTGHGVGLNVHEPPTISSLGETVLEAGMVITIEPGVYIPGWGGVRVEDMVLVEDDGGSVLTTLSKSFKVVS